MSFYEKHAKEKFFPRPIQPLSKADIHNPLRYLLMNAVASRSSFKKTFILLWSNLSSLSIMEAIQQNQNVCSRRHFPGAVFFCPHHYYIGGYL